MFIQSQCSYLLEYTTYLKSFAQHTLYKHPTLNVSWIISVCIVPWKSACEEPQQKCEDNIGIRIRRTAWLLSPFPSKKEVNIQPFSIREPQRACSRHIYVLFLWSLSLPAYIKKYSDKADINYIMQSFSNVWLGKTMPSHTMNTISIVLQMYIHVSMSKQVVQAYCQ